MSLPGSFGSCLDTVFMPLYSFKFSSKDRVYLKYDSTRYGAVVYKSDTTFTGLANNTEIYIYGVM